MTDVLDAFAVIALARDEPGAAEVEALLRRGEAVVTATNLGEALDHLRRVHKQPRERVEVLVQALTSGGVSVTPVDTELIWRAVELRARRYHRRTAALSLADCVALAAARPREDRIVTADAALLSAARAEKIEGVALPDSDGRLLRA